MRHLLAYPYTCIDFSILWTIITLFLLHIEQRLVLTRTLYTILTIKKWKLVRTVCNIMVLNTSLVVLLNEIVNTLITQDPVTGVKITLEHSCTQYHR
jgi:hypothetical protein